MVECWADAEHARPSSTALVQRLRSLYFDAFVTEWRLSDNFEVSNTYSCSDEPLSDAPMMTAAAPASAEASSACTSFTGANGDGATD